MFSVDSIGGSALFGVFRKGSITFYTKIFEGEKELHNRELCANSGTMPR